MWKESKINFFDDKNNWSEYHSIIKRRYQLQQSGGFLIHVIDFKREMILWKFCMQWCTQRTEKTIIRSKYQKKCFSPILMKTWIKFLVKSQSFLLNARTFLHRKTFWSSFETVNKVCECRLFSKWMATIAKGQSTIILPSDKKNQFPFIYFKFQYFR